MFGFLLCQPTGKFVLILFLSKIALNARFDSVKTIIAHRVENVNKFHEYRVMKSRVFIIATWQR